MAVNRVSLFFSVTLVCTLASCLCATMTKTTASPVDINTAARQLVKDIRTAVSEAKSGQYLHLDYQNVLDIEFKATELLERLAAPVSECETNLVIKMAAAGTGSHEVLTLMLAQDAMSVLNGRLSLSLAFLEHVAGQLEDALTQQSADIGAQLASVVFGANTTASIIETAEETIKSVAPSSAAVAAVHPHNGDQLHNRVRRQGGSFNLGSGWSLGFKGLTWQNRQLSVNLGPMWSGIKPNGVKLTIRF